MNKDQVILEAADILNTYCIDEVNKGAIQSIQAAFSADIKTGKAMLAAAKENIKKGETKKAKTQLDAAIKAFKDGRKEAEKIEDDGFLEHMLIGGIMQLIPVVGSIAYAVGHVISWYNLRKQSDKGDAYSNKHPDRKKNLALEFFFGKLRGAGYSRSTVLAGYDKFIEECEKLKALIK